MRRHVADDAELGEVMINDGFPGRSYPLAAPDEVAAGGTRFQTGRVDRRATNAAFAPQVLEDRRVQQASGRRCRQQSAGRLLQRGIVGHAGQAQGLDQRRTVRQMSDQAAIVGLEKALQHQAREELVLRELLRTVAMRV